MAKLCRAVPLGKVLVGRRLIIQTDAGAASKLVVFSVCKAKKCCFVARRQQLAASWGRGHWQRQRQRPIRAVVFRWPTPRWPFSRSMKPPQNLNASVFHPVAISDGSAARREVARPARNLNHTIPGLQCALHRQSFGLQAQEKPCAGKKDAAVTTSKTGAACA